MNPVRNSSCPLGNKIPQGLKIIIKNLHTKIPVPQARLKRAAREVLLSQKRYRRADITVCVVTDASIAKLNARFLGKNAPTDVIAFDLSRKEVPARLVADIVISADTACYNAGAFGTSALYEIYLYVVHGMLHLLGYDDVTAKQRARMQKKAEYFLRKIGIKPNSLCPSIKPKR